MDAKITCDLLLKQLKSSNLNFLLQETPFSAYLTIRKSFIKNLKTNNLFQTSNDSEEILKRKVAALEAENSRLKSNILEHKTEMKDSEHIVIKLEEKVKNAEIQINKNIQESKKNEKQFCKLEELLVEKEKEILKLKTISMNLNTDVVQTKRNLQNVSKSLKVSEKEKLKAKNKCDNLESTLANVKAEKCTLQKTIKKFEKKKKSEEINSKIKQLKDLETKNDDSEEDTTDPIAYNISVSPNPFEVLENNNILSSSNTKSEIKLDFGRNFKDTIEKKREW